MALQEVIVGLVCSLCQQECFQTVEREARLSAQSVVKLRICTRCARQLDAELELETLDALKPGVRKAALKEKSHEWAHSWHGKHVIINHTEYEELTGDPLRIYQIRGTAYYDSKEEGVGYGRIKVVLDAPEQLRVKIMEKSKPDDWPSQWAEIDGVRFGLADKLISHEHYTDKGHQRTWDKPFAIRINWGDRERQVLQEVDEEEDRRAAEAEARRVEAERLAEIERHKGEGI